MKFYKIEKCLIIELSALIMIPSFNFYEFRNLNLKMNPCILDSSSGSIQPGACVVQTFHAVSLSCDTNTGNQSDCTNCLKCLRIAHNFCPLYMVYPSVMAILLTYLLCRWIGRSGKRMEGRVLRLEIWRYGKLARWIWEISRGNAIVI